MSLLDEVKAWPMPPTTYCVGVEGDGYSQDRVYGSSPAWDEDQLRAARESVAAEADARMARLCEAFQQIINVMGPVAAPCCSGCNAEVSGCLRAPMPEDAPRTAAGSPLDRPVGPVAGA